MNLFLKSDQIRHGRSLGLIWVDGQGLITMLQGRFDWKKKSED